MIKGVNKSVIEVADTGNKYFERAILFVNPQYSDKSTELLQSQARLYVSGVDVPRLPLKTAGSAKKKRRYTRQKQLRRLLFAAGVVGLVLLIYLLIPR